MANKTSGNTPSSTQDEQLVATVLTLQSTDTTPPDVPGAPGYIIIDGATDDQGAHQQNVIDHGLTDDLTATLHGHIDGANKMDIRVYANTKFLGYATTDEEGNWSYGLKLDNLSQYTFEVMLKDPGGSSVLVSMPFMMTTTDASNDYQKPVIHSVVDDSGSAAVDIANGQHTSDSTPTIHGTADANILVNIYDGQTLIGAAYTDAAGAWSFTPSTPLADGPHVFSAEEADGTHQSARSDNFVIISNNDAINTADNAPPVDTDNQVPDFTPAIPDAPGYIIIDGATDDEGLHQGEIANNGVTDDLTPILHGHVDGANKMDLMIYANTQFLTIVTTDENGNWSYEPQLADHSQYTFEVLLKDPGGSEILTSLPFTITTTDLNADFPAPLITSVYDDAGDSTGELINGQITDDATPKISGTAEANHLVYIYDQQTQIGSALADASGKWSFTPAQLAAGVHVFSATEMESGHESSHSDNFVIFVEDLTPPTPDAPEILYVVDNVGTLAEEIDSGQVTNDATPEIHGTAQANATVTIYDGTDPLGTAVAGTDGTWTFTPSKAIEGDKIHDLTAIATLGGEPSDASAVFELNLDTVSQAPNILFAAADDGDLFSKGDTADISDGITLQGLGEKDATVTVTLTGPNGVDVVVGTAIVDGSGKWSLVPVPGFWAVGDYTYTAVEVDKAGNTSGESNAFVLTVGDENAIPDAATNVQLYDDVGPHTGYITNGETTDDNQPTMSGKATAGDIVLIYDTDKNTPIGSTVVNPDGTWSFTPATPLVDGAHNFTAVVENPDNHKDSAASAAINFTVVTEAFGPQVPQVLFFEDNTQVSHMLSIEAIKEYNDTDWDDYDSSLLPVFNDRTPTLHGTGEPNSTVNVYSSTHYIKSDHTDGYDGKFLGSAQVDAQGNWSFTCPKLHASQNSDWPETWTDFKIIPVDENGHNVLDKAFNTPLLTITSARDKMSAPVPDADSVTVPQVLFFEDNTQVSHMLSIEAIKEYNDSDSDYYDPSLLPVFNDPTPTLHGTGEPNSTVNVYSSTHYIKSDHTDVNDGKFLGSAQVDAQGNWSFTCPKLHASQSSDWPEAWTDFKIIPVDENGRNVVDKAFNTPFLAITNARDNMSAPVPDADSVTVPQVLFFEDNTQVSHMLSIEAIKQYNDTDWDNYDSSLLPLFNDRTPTLHGTGEPNSTVNVYSSTHYIKSDNTDGYDSKFLGSAHVDAQGNWSFTCPKLQVSQNSSCPESWTDFKIIPVDENGHNVVDKAFNTPFLTISNANDPVSLSEVALHDNHGSAVLDMTNQADHSLYLTTSDILAHAQQNMFIADGKQQLAIQGDKGDVVELKGEDLAANTWTDTGHSTVAGVTYEVYQHTGDNLELLVQQGVELQHS